MFHFISGSKQIFINRISLRQHDDRHSYTQTSIGTIHISKVISTAYELLPKSTASKLIFWMFAAHDGMWAETAQDLWVCGSENDCKLYAQLNLTVRALNVA